MVIISLEILFNVNKYNISNVIYILNSNYYYLKQIY